MNDNLSKSMFPAIGSVFTQPPLPTENLPNRIEQGKQVSDGLEQRVRTLEGLLFGFKNQTIQAYDMNGNPTIFRVLYQEGGAGNFTTVSITPFLVQTGPTSGTIQVLPGLLLSDANPGSTLTVGKISNPYTNPGTFVGIPVNASGTDNVWLEAAVTNYVPSNPQLCSSQSLGPSGTPFNLSAAPWNTGAVVENDGATPPAQTYFRYLIANTDFTPGTQNPPITQVCFSNLVCSLVCFDGYPAIYPIPV